ncbi:MAG TPA: zinc metallopeptidase [Gemmataceae bacterium]|nr:zinc metallopeptidase [Gemmataceae bacterium]
MFFFDPVYFLFLLPGILLAAWAQWRVRSAYDQAGRISPQSGMSGAEAANEVMHAAGVEGVGIEPVAGYLSDHYDPSSKVLRLSEGVYQERSLAALGIAAHEAGHAIQDNRGYSPLVIRNAMVPMANFGSQAAWFIMFAGFAVAGFMHEFTIGRVLVYLGIAAFSLTVLFQLVNLPVEFDASRRAKIALVDGGLITADEKYYVSKVLNAAALTYVAATLTSLLTLLYFLVRSGVLGGRRR